MTTTIRTAKATYTVTAVTVPYPGGPAELTVTLASGRTRKLTMKDTGRPRYDAAVAHFFAEKHREAETVRKPVK